MMQINSPLSNIAEVLKQAVTSAVSYRATLNKNEAATRAVLIDPVLRALGWDTGNTTMVEVEKTDTNMINRVDYALFDSNSIVKVVVEAKPLGTALIQPGIKKNLVQYAFTYDPQGIFLTDGLVWHHYTNFQPGNTVPSRMLNIETDDPIEVAAYLVQALDAAKYWPEQPDIDVLQQQVTQLDSALATLTQEVAHLRAAASTRLTNAGSNQTGPVNPPLLPDPVGVTFVDLGAMPDATGTKPDKLRLPDGSVMSVTRWKDVLRECCKFVLANNPALPVPFGDKSGKKVSLFAPVRPQKGISAVEEQYNGRTIYIYLNYDANHCVENAIHVLKQIPAGRHVIQAAVSFH
ncbi:MAG: hypothetical protein NVS4B8_11980 [Herpetosiphon sp.]